MAIVKARALDWPVLVYFSDFGAHSFVCSVTLCAIKPAREAGAGRDLTREALGEQRTAEDG